VVDGSSRLDQSMLQCVVMCCSMLQCVVMCCSMLQQRGYVVDVWSRLDQSMLQCVVICCIVLQCRRGCVVDVWSRLDQSVLQCVVVVCCSVEGAACRRLVALRSKYVAVHCTVLQFIVVVALEKKDPYD